MSEATEHSSPPLRWWALWLIRSVFRVSGYQAFWLKRTSTTTSLIPLTFLVSIFFYFYVYFNVSQTSTLHEVTCWVCFTAYTELAMSTVKQSQAIPFTGPYSLLVCHLRNLTGMTAVSVHVHWATSSMLEHMSYFVLFLVHFYHPWSPHFSGDVEELDGTEKNTLKIFKNITLIHEVGMVLLEVSGEAGSTDCGPDVGEQDFALLCLLSCPILSPRWMFSLSPFSVDS